MAPYTYIYEEMAAGPHPHCPWAIEVSPDLGPGPHEIHKDIQALFHAGKEKVKANIIIEYIKNQSPVRMSRTNGRGCRLY